MSTYDDPPGEHGVSGINRLAIASGVIAWAGWLLPALASAQARAELPSVFWVLGAAYVLCFVIPSSPNRWLDAAPAWAQLALGVVLVLLAPTYQLSAVLLVVSIVSVAFVAPLPVTAVVAAMQTMLVSYVGSQVVPGDGGFSLVSAMVYASLQLFAVVMVEATRREKRARRALDEVNAALVERNEELDRAHAQLAEASRSDERLRIARDLHDTVGHQLTALALNLEVAAHLAASTPAAEPVQACRDLSKNLLRDVRGVVRELRDEQGSAGADLGSTLHRLADGIPRPRVVLRLEDLPPLSAAQHDAVRRCVQETITNAARHGQAETLVVDVRAEDGELVVRGVDDGRGAASVVEGMGLAGMRERFAALGGVVTVATEPGAGFRLVARMPVSA